MSASTRLLLTVCASLVAQLAVANEPVAMHLQRWVADPAKSSLGFTATQEGGEFSGVFHKFSSGLELQANDTDAILQSVSTNIDLGSVDTSYQERDDYLAQQDWFHITEWPQAKFVSTQVIDHGDGSYTATGELTLRGINKTVDVNLKLEIETNRERGTLVGTAAIRRLDFGVGQGDWTNTQWVGDDVNVQFDLHILRAFE
jgi:polyisoprenoid-binding protein YceI